MYVDRENAGAVDGVLSAMSARILRNGFTHGECYMYYSLWRRSLRLRWDSNGLFADL